MMVLWWLIRQWKVCFEITIWAWLEPEVVWSKYPTSFLSFSPPLPSNSTRPHKGGMSLSLPVMSQGTRGWVDSFPLTFFQGCYPGLLWPLIWLPLLIFPTAIQSKAKAKLFPRRPT